jgi:uncharacterized membrane protein YagU involved in acid resistance
MTNMFSGKIIKAAFAVGTLDLLAASIQFYLKTNKGPALVFKFIASGLFGKEAFTEGNIMIVYGILFHYVIAFIFTLLFFWVCENFPALMHFRILTGVLYGVFTWVVMNLIVLPLSKVNTGSFNLVNSIIGMLILIMCMGIPLAVFAFNKISIKN